MSGFQLLNGTPIPKHGSSAPPPPRRGQWTHSISNPAISNRPLSWTIFGFPCMFEMAGVRCILCFGLMGAYSFQKETRAWFQNHFCGSTTGELIRPSPVILYDRTRAYACVKTSPGVKCSVNSTFQTLFPTCPSAYLCINNDQKSFSLFEQIFFQM